MSVGADKSADMKRATASIDRPARYGPDVDLSAYRRPQQQQRERVESLKSLTKQIREAAALAGIEADEVDRAASFFQIDYSVIYEQIQSSFQGQLELSTLDEAIERYDWLEEYVWRTVPMDLDKYTAAVALQPTGGFFLRVLPGRHVERAIQACLFVQENHISQNVHNVIIMEENSHAQLVTGCTLSQGVRSGVHVGVTEIFLKPNSTLGNTMVHNWSEGFHVRPRTGVAVQQGATFVSNYVLLQPVRSAQMFPVARLVGPGARAQFHNIIVGRKDSVIDIGARVELLAADTQAESVSRAVATDGATIHLRGELVGRDNTSRGHLDCRGMLLSPDAGIHAIPELEAAGAPNCVLSHEAAIGPIADDVVQYLMARGLPRDEAIATLVRGFLRFDFPGLPDLLTWRIEQALAATAENSL